MNENDHFVMPLDSDLLRTFLAVVRHRNVTHAASALHRTQSAVSVQIKRLEERLETSLFRREARGVSLTDAGERLLQSAERIVRDLDRTAATFRPDPIGGLVRVGIPDDYGSDVLPEILGAFAAQHPSVEVSVRCEFSVGFQAAVKRGELDLAVCAEESPVAGMTVLLQEQTLWACGRGFAVSQDQPVPLALFERACWWRDAAIGALQQAGRSYRIAYSSESVSGIKAAVSAGLAAGVLSRGTVDPAMRVLRAGDGFPALPKTVLSLLQNPESCSPAVSAMAETIRRGFAKVSQAA